MVLRLAGIGIVVALVVAAGGCDSANRPGPPPTPVVVESVPPPPVPVAVTVKGRVVDAAERPVGDATVKFSGDSSSEVSTDAGGYFTYATTTALEGDVALVTREGYEESSHLLSFLAPGIQTIRAYPTVRLTAGQSTRLDILDFEALRGGFCGEDFLLNCRQVRVVAPATGRLTVVADAMGPRRLVFVTQSRNTWDFAGGPTSTLAIQVEGGSETLLVVYAEWFAVDSQTITIELRTSLEPATS
jgi:hypothetical protein